MRLSVSVVIPVYNEEEIIEERIAFLSLELRQRFERFEIILTENGSTDATKEIARRLSLKLHEVAAVIDDGIADYGQALINGINSSKFEAVSILELDYLDLDFLERSHDLLPEYDLIIGSKKISPGIDRRPVKRKVFTQLYNILLKVFFHLKLTETHGLKTFKKSKIDRIINGCITRHSVYPSELVIRASRDKELKVSEIPLSLPLEEIRNTRIKPVSRLQATVKDLILLHRALKA